MTHNFLFYHWKAAPPREFLSKFDSFSVPTERKGIKCALGPQVVKPILHHPTRTFSSCLYFLCHKAVWGLCTIHHSCFVNLCSSPPCCSKRNPFLLSDVPICFMVLLYLSSLPEVCLTINTKTRRKKKKEMRKLTVAANSSTSSHLRTNYNFLLHFCNLQFAIYSIANLDTNFSIHNHICYASGNRSYFF